MYHYDYPHPAVTADVAIFTIRDGQLKLLLIRRTAKPYRGKWALPGVSCRSTKRWKKQPAVNWKKRRGNRRVSGGFRWLGRTWLTLSPYVTSHIKRFGDYVIDAEAVPDPIDPSLPL